MDEWNFPAGNAGSGRKGLETREVSILSAVEESAAYSASRRPCRGDIARMSPWVGTAKGGDGQGGRGTTGPDSSPGSGRRQGPILATIDRSQAGASMSRSGRGRHTASNPLS